MSPSTRSIFTGAIPDALPRGLVLALTAAPDGGWTQVTEPRALEHDGIVYVGFIDGDDGHVKVAKLDGETVTIVTVATAPSVDTHNAPSLHVRSDGKMLLTWSSQTASGMFQHISTNALPDISAWGAATNLGATRTYPSFVSIGSTLYLFHRHDSGGKGRMCYSASSDDGDTWGAQVVVATPGSASACYFVVNGDGSRIDVALSTGNAASDAGTTVHHMYFDGAWKGADGTALGSPIFTVENLPAVYDAADGAGWPSAIVSDGPTFVYAVKVTDDTSYRRARWNGTGWEQRTIGLAGTPLADPAPSPTLTDADTMYAPVGAHGSEALYRWKGPGWSAVPVTVPSGDIYPARIHDGTTRKVVWLRGTYTSYLDNSLRVMAGR